MSDYIPSELIPNILARLPVDDVLRCTCVCKSWYSLITSPSFTSSHLNLSSPNQEPRLLIRYYRKESRYLGYCLHSDNQTFDKIAELDPPFNRNRDWGIIEALNGLMCLYHSPQGTIMLWNPSLRKSLILPNSRVLFSSKVHHSVGFGFVATNYKILKFSYAFNTDPQVEIYQLSTGSWRDLKLEDYSYVNVNYYPQAHLNGILHWYTRLKRVNPPFSALICSFDMKTEKFRALMVPSCLRDDDRASFKPSTFRESLCLIDITSKRLWNIWVMKEYGVADSWEKLFSIDREQHDLKFVHNFRQNGEILIEKYDDGGPEFVSYDCYNNRVKNIGVHGLYIIAVYNYMDNLVLIKCPNEVKIDEESTKISN